METQSKTAVDIIQELIAIHTTRKEVVTKLTSAHNVEDNQTDLSAASEQSDQFIAELLPELANFGDAVKDSPSQDNEYQVLWKESLGGLSSIAPNDTGILFNKLEDALKKIYQHLLDTNNELPASLLKIVATQNDRLK